MVKESIPMSKYTSLLELLSELETRNLETLYVNKHVSYDRYKTALSLLKSLSENIDSEVTDKLKKSPVVTVLMDESTDIAVHHKLCVTARVLEPDTMSPSTLSLTDLRITSATGKGILEENITKVTGLGTDGASVMTGRKEGLTGQFLQNNPHVINTHCSAHRLVLCSEQAAENAPGMKYYQGVLEALCYYFKKSPQRNDKLLAVQKRLDEPQVKCREVHQVRRLSFYHALDAIYRTIDSLLSFFSTATDPKAKGMKKMGEDFFLEITYELMDIPQTVMRLYLFFQRKDIDIGSVQAVVDTCLRDLEGMLTEDEQPAPTSYRHQLQDHPKDGIYKGNHTITQSHYSHNKSRVDFIKALIDKTTKRFPVKQLMTSMCIFGTRPITFLSDEELESWDNESLEVLLDHFGNPKSHTFKN